MDFGSLQPLSLETWALYLLIASCIAMLLVASRFRDANGRMLHRRVGMIVRLVLVVLLGLFLGSDNELARIIKRVVFTGRGLLAALMIAGFLVGFTLIKHRRSLRSRR